MQISGSSIIVTGGSSGIGLSTTERLLSLGARIAIWDMNPPKELINNTKFYQVDVTQDDSVKQALTQTIADFGPISAVVNSAGVAKTGPKLSKIDVQLEERFEMIIRVNLIGLFNVTRHVAHHMAQQRIKGVIVNIGSIAAFSSQNGFIGYGASKGAVNAMTLPLARDLAFFNIRVVNVSPGMLKTPMSEALADGYLQKAKVPAGRLGLTTEIAQAIQMCLENDYINGTTIVVDGGDTGGPKL